jgi:hypothetical protein
MAIVEAFPLAINCPEFTENAWLFLKNHLLEFYTTHNFSTTTTQDKILKQFLIITKKLSTASVSISKPLSYAVYACLALAHII